MTGREEQLLSPRILMDFQEAAIYPTPACHLSSEHNREGLDLFGPVRY